MSNITSRSIMILIGLFLIILIILTLSSPVLTANIIAEKPSVEYIGETYHVYQDNTYYDSLSDIPSEHRNDRLYKVEYYYNNECDDNNYIQVDDNVKDFSDMLSRNSCYLYRETFYNNVTDKNPKVGKKFVTMKKEDCNPKAVIIFEKHTFLLGCGIKINIIPEDFSEFFELTNKVYDDE